MKKFLLLVLFCLCQNAFANTQDWSKFFKSWENGCHKSTALSELQNSLSHINEKDGKFYLQGSIKLPAPYRQQSAKTVSFHKITIKDEQGTYLLDQVRLALKGTYYGLPVVHYSQTFMLETAGMEYNRLLLNTPIENARRVLANKYKPRKHFNVVLEGYETLQAKLLPITINNQPHTIVECSYIYG